MGANNHAVHPVLKEIKEKAMEHTKEAREKIDVDAHDRPWFYVGIIAFFSSIFGFFLGRKSK